MEALAIKDILLLIISFVITVGLGIVGYSVKALHKDMKEKINEAVGKAEGAATKAGGVERELMEFKASIPRYYVLKDDYIRTISVFEKKLDDMNVNILKLVKRENGPESHL